MAKCRVVNVDGTPVRVRGDREPSQADIAALSDVIKAAKAKMAADDAADPAAAQARNDRQARMLERIRRP